MARDSRSEALTEALDAAEARLDALDAERNADADVVAAGLGEVARALNAALREPAQP